MILQVIKYRKIVIAATLLIVLLSIIPLSQIRINSDLESYYPDDMISKQGNEKVKEHFQNSDRMVVIMESKDILDNKSLKRLSEISREFEESALFGEVISLANAKSVKGDQGYLQINPIVSEIPLTSEEKYNLRDRIKSNDLVYGKLISKDFSKAIILAGYKNGVTDKEIIDEVNNILARHKGEERVITTGLPLLRNEANAKISRDMATLLPLSVIVMLIILSLSFREISSVLLPCSVVFFSTLFALSLIPLFGWELSIIGILVPVMMIAIANNYGIHFVSRYQEMQTTLYRNSKVDIVNAVLTYIWKPVLICGLTTIAGVMGLSAHILIPARQMGVVTSIAVAFALLLSLTFIPAMIPSCKTGRKQEKSAGKDFSSGILARLASVVVRRPKVVVTLFISLLALSSAGLYKLESSSDSGNILPDKHQYSEGGKILDNEFGGSKYIYLLVSGDIVSPDILKKLEELQIRIAGIPGVGSAVSVTNIIREISKALNDKTDSLYDRIPPSREGAAQYLELYLMGSSAEDLDGYIDFNYSYALATIQYKAKTMKETDKIINLINKEIVRSNLQVTTGGYSLIEYEMNRSVIRGQYYSLIFAFVAIFILLSLIFKSIKAGILGSLPLVYAVLTTFGLMGLLHIKLDIVTALISSVSIGLGVDFTIHLFWRIRSETFNGRRLSEALITSVSTTGKGITVNAFSVMAGFSVLFASGFPMIRNFALLILLSLFLCLVSGVILVPALSLLLKPRFLIQKKS
jgi:predicted RND superfamily exporter protein